MGRARTHVGGFAALLSLWARLLRAWMNHGCGSAAFTESKNSDFLPVGYRG